MLPEKLRFCIVFTKYAFGYLRDVSRFVTHEVTTATSVQTYPYSQTIKLMQIWTLLLLKRNLRKNKLLIKWVL